jgi:sulfonate transport system permease protein
VAIASFVVAGGILIAALLSRFRSGLQSRASIAMSREHWGAKPSFLVLKVAIPAALPHVFVGLFMGLGSSFAVLVIAEMIGVKAGLGWYLQWAQGWAAYANMYAALIVMSLLCSGAITQLLRTRDRLLVWQRGVVKW